MQAPMQPPMETLVDKIARAVLYEGYILYPYRPSVKNQQRWTFGGIFPKDYSESSGGTDPDAMQAQCLIAGGETAAMKITLRFLHLTDRSIEQMTESSEREEPAFKRVDAMHVGGQEYRGWQEAMEREVVIDRISLGELFAVPLRQPFSFDGSVHHETLRDGEMIVARLVRVQQSLRGMIEISVDRVADDAARLTIRVLNETSIPQDQINGRTCGQTRGQTRDSALLQSFASTHLVLTASNGDFISLTDPPARFAPLAATCVNAGCWPVLVGEHGQTDTLLVSPIILPDYPQIAPESPGDLFDGCEIDEILTLRIMTLTDAEKEQAAATDERVKQLLQRTESLARDQLMNLHGALRSVAAPTLSESTPSQPSAAAQTPSAPSVTEPIRPDLAPSTLAREEPQHA